MVVASIEGLSLEAKRVFVRVDFNVPLGEGGLITDDSRIRAALPTIEHARDAGARLVLASHLGRPKGKPNPALSLRPVGDRLAELLGQEILFPDDCVGDGPRYLVNNLRDGQVVLLENLRFHAEEEACDDGFSRQLASLADVYVNDAFGAAHRAHASTVGITHHVGEKAAGLLMHKEVANLQRLLDKPERPFVAILGGAKVKDKIGVISNLLSKVDDVLVGGAMAYTFLAAQGHDVAGSRVEPDRFAAAEKILERAETLEVGLHLPVDHRVVPSADDIGPAAQPSVVRNGELPAGSLACDIGPRTAELFAEIISKARTIFWNGPMGIFELAPFAEGTIAVARAVAHAGAFSVVGGGDSVAALGRAGVRPFISHVSTGGGASLEFVEGRRLPGLEALGAYL